MRRRRSGVEGASPLRDDVAQRPGRFAAASPHTLGRYESFPLRAVRGKQIGAALSAAIQNHDAEEPVYEVIEIVEFVYGLVELTAHLEDEMTARGPQLIPRTLRATAWTKPGSFDPSAQETRIACAARAPPPRPLCILRELWAKLFYSRPRNPCATT